MSNANDQITKILLNMSRAELLQARAQLLATHSTTRLVSMRRIVRSKLDLVAARLADLEAVSTMKRSSLDQLI